MLQVLVTIFQSFVAEKRHGAMQKLFMKKERKEEKVLIKKKIDKCPRYLKQWVLRCPLEKKEIEKEMNKIAPVL
jgi:hypothetical protein